MVLQSDTTLLDSLGIVPGSLVITDLKGDKIPDSLYKTVPAKGLIIFNKKNFTSDSLSIYYRSFNIPLHASHYHKKFSDVTLTPSGMYNPFRFRGEETSSGFGILKYEGLNKNGSISRGISFGNNQDVVLNSNLNLQLSGKVNPNLNILAAITDQNIPLQPEGNTQQLQDFDKVYIQLFNEKQKLTAGDFEINKSDSYFMNFYKKAQGASYSGIMDPGVKLFNQPVIMKVSGSGAISRGKYARNIITGIEGNQGPYRLRGNNNESFIIVIAGTERIYLNGELLERGQNADYIIDYNTAEVRFTPKRLITKDSRIIAEIEYTDKNFARSLFFLNNEYETGKLRLKLNFYTEQDSKNQPVVQTLNEEQKLFLETIGDSINKAFYPNVDSVAFDPSLILYRKVDTLGYNPVYVYSTDSQTAHFRVSFSNVGQGNGDYIQLNSAANGKVFKWIAPQNGIKQGTYAPIVLLITPKQQQMYTAGAEYNFSQDTKLGIETALSRYDVNLYSDKDKGNDYGKAFMMNFQKSSRLPFTENWKISSGLNMEHTDRHFIPIERFRPVEFERNWNIPRQNISENQTEQSYGTFNLTVQNNQNKKLGYSLNVLKREGDYTGMQHVISGGLFQRKSTIQFQGSWLNTEGRLSKSEYYKHNILLSKHLGKFTAGVKEDTEHNSIFHPNTDSLITSSFAWNQYEAFVTHTDTGRINSKLNYIRRYDYAAGANNFVQTTFGESYNLTSEINLSKNQRLVGTLTFRKLSISDTVLSKLKPESNILSRIEYSFSALKGGITSSTFYEIGSGQELKREFTFLEVQQGKGIYGWFDYNKNGIKELNEFEIVDVTSFPDLARYIKIYTPTNQYVKSYNNQFNAVIYLSPDRFTDIRIINRFSDQVSLKLDRKTIGNKAANAFNPFEKDVADTSLLTINSYLRNTLFFNRSNAVFGSDYNYTQSSNKSLLTNGFETRLSFENRFNIRYNFTQEFLLNLSLAEGNKKNISQFFSNRDYNIKFYDLEPKLSFQPNATYRISILYRYLNKVNIMKSEQEGSFQQRAGVELKFSTATQGSFLLKFNLIKIDYNGEVNTPVSYELLEGFNPGNNITWGLTIQRNLSQNMQLNLNYDGRKSETTKVIHTGNVQVRAFF